MSEPRYPSSVVERFLRYVTVDTRAVEGAERFPSSEGQLVLQRRLVDELRELGVDEVELDRHGYVYATVPATAGLERVPPIGFVAHVDTSPEMPGDDVRPIVHRNYRGQDLVLPDAPDAVLRVADDPALGEQVGHDVITASGTTLLGADDKAGVAEIMAAVEVLLRHRPEVARGPVRVAFTPDEEIGQGTRHFDVERFGARCAYTLDGGSLGDLQAETFSADTLVAEFCGFNTHPGYAKGRMVNALKLAARFVASLPEDRLSPETTEGHEGYVHPYRLEGGVERARVTVLLRDFKTPALREQERLLRELAERAVADDATARVEITVTESYRNMKEVLDRHPEVVEAAREAMRRAEITPRETPIRGGTDGSRLCFMGLPTPNLFAGEHNFHSRLEWTSSRELHKAVEVIVELCRAWAERAR